jgi:putative beta barrel porin BBP7
MRRTITTLMFLAVGGLAFAAHAADHSRGTSNWQYYAAGQNSYRISDDDEDQAASAGPQSVVAQAVGEQQRAGQERNALYVADNSGGSGIMPTGYLDGGNGCGCNNNCGCGSGSCLGDCWDDCSCNAFRFEYLGWFTRGRNVPPLVTTSGAGTARTDAGVLGLPTTATLYGNDPIGTNLRSGLRLTYSHLFADGMTWGTVRFWGIEDGSETFAINSTNNPIIARPFFNTALGIQDSFLVAFPGVTAPGSINVLSKNDLIGADAWASRNWYNDGYSSLDILAGYQFTRLDDSVVINSTSTSIDPAAVIPIGSTLNVVDSFRTQNEFHGGSLGVIGRSYRGVVTLEALGKIALGNMHQAVITNGSTTVTLPGGAPTTSSGGLLVPASNVGTFDRNRMAFVPELNVNLLYNVNQSWRILGGYSFIYWSSVVLAGNQINTNVPVPAANAVVPPVKIQRTDFWVQGFNLGAEYRW